MRCEDCNGTGERFISKYRAADIGTAPAGDAALERAHREGLTIVATTVPGVFVVSSRISRHMYYKTTLTSCTCQAGQFGKMCKHKALVSESLNAEAA